MKYTKTAAALALAGMAAAPLAQAEPTVTLSGSIGINLGSSDDDRPGGLDGDFQMSGDDTVLNIAATDTLASGLEGYANYRLDGALTGDDILTDNAYLGIKGDFGDFRIGEVPDALEYGQVAGDLFDVGGENAGLSYTGSFGATTVGINYGPAGNADKISGGVKFSAAGFGIGIGVGNINDDSDRMSVGATYSLGGVTIGLAYKDFDSHGTIGAKLSGTAGDIGWGLTYEGQDGDVADDTKIRLDASYGLGGGWTVSGRVNMLDAGDSLAPVLDDDGVQVLDAAGVGVVDQDVTDYRIQFAKSF